MNNGRYLKMSSECLNHGAYEDLFFLLNEKTTIWRLTETGKLLTIYTGEHYTWNDLILSKERCIVGHMGREHNGNV